MTAYCGQKAVLEDPPWMTSFHSIRKLATTLLVEANRRELKHARGFSEE